MDTREGKEDIAGNTMARAAPLAPCQSFACSSYSIHPILISLGAFYNGPPSEKLNKWFAQLILQCGRAIVGMAQVKEDNE